MSSFSSEYRTKYLMKMNNVVVTTSTITRMMMMDGWMDGEAYKDLRNNSRLLERPEDVAEEASGGEDKEKLQCQKR